MSEKGVLYLIPCPIDDAAAVWDVLPEGNRAIMNALDEFIVENVRSARRFLSRAGVKKPINELTFNELNEHTDPQRATELIRPLLQGRSVGVISEAGVPAVADPGAAVVEAAHRAGVRVVPLVGPSSILLALMASGMSGQSFAFTGYLPVKEPDRTRAIRALEKRARTEGQTQLFIETPYRNVKLFKQLIEILNPETRLLAAVALTSPDEDVRTLFIKEWRSTPPPVLEKRPAIFGIG